MQRKIKIIAVGTLYFKKNRQISTSNHEISTLWNWNDLQYFITLKVLCFFLRDLSLTFLSLGPAQNTSPHWFSGLGFLIHLMHPLLPVLLWKFHTPLMHNPSAKLWKKKYFIQKQEVRESSHSPYFLNTMYKSQNI